MTNEETIEKLNDGLIQLIDAYEILQLQNQELEEELEQEKAKNADLEYKLSDFNNNSEVQATKMDGMLSKIKRLLDTSSSVSSEPEPQVEIKEEEPEVENIEFGNTIENTELKLDFEEEKEPQESILDIKLEDNSSNNYPSTNKKVDLGRMEKLLNGLNNR
jgi:DNA-directed RNA polymerase specialized sigma54-like protein